MNITLRQLRAFVAVSQARSFTAAAIQLNLTQSAVSMLVRQLESELGLPLFDRVARKVAPTEFGQQLLPLSVRMLEDLRQVVDGAVDLRALRRGALRRGVLRLAVPQLTGCTWMPPLLAAYERQYPQVTLKLVDTVADDVIAAVRRNDVELGVGPERPTGPDIAARFLRAEPIRLVCPADHRLAGRRRVAWKDTQGERWIIYSGEFNQALQRALAEYAPDVTIRWDTEVGYLTTALALVGQGMGITAAPAYAEALAGQFGVCFLRLGSPVIERAFHIYARRGHALSPAAQQFVELLGGPP